MEMIQAVGPPGVLQKVARKSTRLLGPLHPPKEHRSLSLPTIFESDLEPEIQGDGTRSDTLSSEGARDGGLKTQRPRLGAFDADVQTSSTLPLNSIVSKSSGRHSQRSKAKREPHLRDRFASNPSTDSSDPLARAVSLGSSSEMVTQRRQQQQHQRAAAAGSRQQAAWAPSLPSKAVPAVRTTDPAAAPSAAAKRTVGGIRHDFTRSYSRARGRRQACCFLAQA